MNNDLISREALKKALKEKFDDFIPEGVYDEIDNAPTVAEDYSTGYQDGLEDGLNDIRPQGEWIAREDMNHLDENKVVHNHFECNKCGFIHDFIDGHTSQYNFCPNCGADMRKDGAE